MKYEKIIYGLIILGIFLLSLFIRSVLPYNSVLGTSTIQFGGNDPYYNFRLVENTLHNFPQRIFYDSYTFYPHGTPISFAPGFDWLIACIIWILGLGNPYTILGQKGIETIFAWFAPILGALVVFPTYLIGKHLWNKNTGIISALIIAVLPGQFLSRSLLGFTDHHIMEVLMSTITILLLILTIKKANDKKIRFDDILRKNWTQLKTPILYSILSGIALGSFYLSWNGAPLFLLILMLFGIVQHIIQHLKEESTEYLSIVTLPAFIIALLMVVPLSFTAYEGFVRFQIISLILGILVFLILGLTSTILKYKEIDIKAYPVILLGIGIILVIFVSLLIPEIYAELLGKLRTLSPSITSLTIQEANPMKMRQIVRWFSTTFFVAILGFGFIGWNILKKFKSEEILFLVWSIVILFSCFGQNRFAYYYAVNVALLCGVASWKIIEYIGFRNEKPKQRVKGKSKKNKIVQKKQPFYKNYHLLGIIGLILLIVVAPPLNISLTTAKYPGGINDDWYNSLIWMRDNTPELDIDYYGRHETSSKFTYPNSTYSIMSWWDYGHWITTIAHRIPIANPFQQGAHTAAEYLIEIDESKGNEILNRLDTKYVITDFPMVDFMVAPTYPNPKYVMPIWAGKNPNPLQTIEVRLHFFDGSEIKSEGIEALQHYRLVYESSTFVLPYMIIDARTNRTLGWQTYHGAYEPIKNDLFKLYHGAMIQGQQGLMAQTPKFFHPFAFVKIFEYVNGTVIREEVPTNSTCTLTMNVTTNQGRTFTYTQTQVESNGYCEFVIPYEEGVSNGIAVERYEVEIFGKEVK